MPNVCGTTVRGCFKVHLQAHTLGIIINRHLPDRTPKLTLQAEPLGSILTIFENPFSALLTMNTIARFFALYFLYLLSVDSIPAQTTFQKYYGDGVTSQFADQVVAVSDGFIIAGTTNNVNPNYRLFFMKIGLDGSMMWMKHYADPGVQLYFSDLIEANDGGFLAVGIIPEGISIGILLKTDADGNLQWQKKIASYAENRRNGGHKLCRVDGGYIVSGGSQKGDTHPTLTRIDNQGNTLWSKRYAANGFDNPVVFACFASNDTIFACGGKDSVATYHLFRASTGDTLYSQWFRAPGSVFSKSFYDMAPAPNGDWLLSGLIEVKPTSGDPIPPANGNHRLWVCRISRNGQLQWSKIYPASATSSLQTSAGGRITALAGDRYLLVNKSYWSDPVLIEIDGQGEVIWSYQYGYKNSNEVLYSAIPSPDGGILALGGAKFQGVQKEQIIVVKTDDDGLVGNCCSQPAGMTALLYPVEIAVGNLNKEFPFNATTDWGIDATDFTLSSGDYCPPQHQTILVNLCQGDSLVINGIAYTQSGVVETTVPGPRCDTVITYQILAGTNPTRLENVFFCPGDTVFLQGIAFTAPGTISQSIAAASGLCDTIVTYSLLYEPDLALGKLSLTCPNDMVVQAPAGEMSVPVSFPDPVVSTDCVCPGLLLEQTDGLPSGSAFDLGIHTVCFEAKDKCGNLRECCFQIQVAESDATPCDVKVNGCIRFELLRIALDAAGQRNYHFRVQNNCSQKLQYVAFQIPDGIKALGPNQTYQAPSGRSYGIRNPNFSPQYSIRFSSMGNGIHGGESDAFSYALPGYSTPDYIAAMVKLEGLAWAGVHLNTFNCPLEFQAQARASEQGSMLESFKVFPNPASQTIHLYRHFGNDSSALWQLLNLKGEVVQELELDPERDSYELDVSHLQTGLYLNRILGAGQIAKGKHVMIMIANVY